MTASPAAYPHILCRDSPEKSETRLRNKQDGQTVLWQTRKIPFSLN